MLKTQSVGRLFPPCNVKRRHVFYLFYFKYWPPFCSQGQLIAQNYLQWHQSGLRGIPWENWWAAGLLAVKVQLIPAAAVGRHRPALACALLAQVHIDSCRQVWGLETVRVGATDPATLPGPGLPIPAPLHPRSAPCTTFACSGGSLSACSCQVHHHKLLYGALGPCQRKWRIRLDRHSVTEARIS